MKELSPCYFVKDDVIEYLQKAFEEERDLGEINAASALWDLKFEIETIPTCPVEGYINRDSLIKGEDVKIVFGRFNISYVEMASKVVSFMFLIKDTKKLTKEYLQPGTVVDWDVPGIGSTYRLRLIGEIEPGKWEVEAINGHVDEGNFFTEDTLLNCDFVSACFENDYPDSAGTWVSTTMAAITPWLLMEEYDSYVKVYPKEAYGTGVAEMEVKDGIYSLTVNRYASCD